MNKVEKSAEYRDAVMMPRLELSYSSIRFPVAQKWTTDGRDEHVCRQTSAPMLLQLDNNFHTNSHPNIGDGWLRLREGSLLEDDLSDGRLLLCTKSLIMKASSRGSKAGE